MLREIFVLSAFCMLGGCATDVVLKPAVSDFVTKGQAAAAAVAQSYANIAADSEKAAAMRLAANPDCGLTLKIVTRSVNSANLARYVKDNNIRDLYIPSNTTLCLTKDEMVEIGNKAPNFPFTSSSVVTTTIDEFKPQLDTIAVMVDYIAVLAKSAGDPKLVAKSDIDSLSKTLTGIATEVGTVATSLNFVSSADGSAIDSIATTELPKYSGAIGGLANDIEVYVGQGRDVQRIRTVLLRPDDHFDDLVSKIGEAADCWLLYDRSIRQDMLISTAGAEAKDFATQNFDKRLLIAQSYLADNTKMVADKSSCDLPAAAVPAAGTATASLPPITPFGSMMQALIEGHDHLRDIAENKQKLTAAERRKEIGATLDRLASTLTHIAAIAAFFA